MKITHFDANYPWNLGNTTLSQGGGVAVDTGNSGSSGGGGGGGAPTGPAGGDLSGSYPDPTVVGIQGTPVDALPAIATEYLNGDGHWTTPPSGGTLSTPTVVQKKFSTGVNTTNPVLTLASTPTNGNRIILGLNFVGRGATGVSSTNTTWTQMIVGNDATSYYEVWVGVAAASAGTIITVTTGSSNYASLVAMEITDALTPTAGSYFSGAMGPPGSNGFPGMSGILTTTSGRLLAFLYGADNSTDQLVCIPSVPHVGMTGQTANGTALAVGYAPNGSVSMIGLGGSVSLINGAWGIIIEIT